MPRDRQSIAAGCRGPGMMALLASSLFVTRIGAAQVEVTIVPLAELVAPTVVTLTASVSARDPVIDYRWSGLEASPRCRRSRCDLGANVASCRRVEVEVTTALGELGAASAQICVNDHAGGRPPRAELELAEGVGDEPILVRGSVVPGTDPLLFTKLYVDDTEVEGLEHSLDRDGGCHAVDLLAADTGGRIGLDRRTVCTDPSAPRLWIGADADPCPPVGQTLSLCTESDHPAGLALAFAGGDAPIDGCSNEFVPPRLQRRFARARDERGVEVTASLFICGSPRAGAPVLFFALAPDRTIGIAGRNVEVTIEVAGGNPPFTASGALLHPSGGRAELTAVGTSRTLKLQGLAPVRVGDWRLEVEVTDEQGLSATAVGVVEVKAAPTSVEPNGVSSDAGFACSHSGRPEGSGWLATSIAFLFLAARRRR